MKTVGEDIVDDANEMEEVEQGGCRHIYTYHPNIKSSSQFTVQVLTFVNQIS